MIRNLSSKRIIASIVLLSTTAQVFSFDLKEPIDQGHAVVQLGAYWSIQGKSQYIDINGAIGNHFTVSDRTSSSGLVGLGYFTEEQEKNGFNLSSGVNAFYLAPTSVLGEIVQEEMYNNLSYRYHVTHYPVYAVVKSTLDLKSKGPALTFDLGIGPNFMRTSRYQDYSLDGGDTVPDNAFSGRTTTTLSAMTGVGIKFNNFFGQAPLECGYKFFYLGQGRLKKNTNQLLNNLETGNDYANALMCSLTV